MSPDVSPNVSRIVTSFNKAISVYDQHFTQNEKKNTASYDGIDIVAINRPLAGRVWPWHGFVFDFFLSLLILWRKPCLKLV